MKRLLMKRWIESDEWSGQADDGISLHLNHEHLDEFVKQHWAKYPSKSAPSYYTAPSIFHTAEFVTVTDDLFNEVADTEVGKRFYTMGGIIQGE